MRRCCLLGSRYLSGESSAFDMEVEINLLSVMRHELNELNCLKTDAFKNLMVVLRKLKNVNIEFHLCRQGWQGEDPL